MDSALEASAEGVRAVRVSLAVLLLTGLVQAVVVVVTGSVALLADTIHNLSDALTAVPLWVAFVLGRRLPTRRYTYGFGRAEDPLDDDAVPSVEDEGGDPAERQWHSEAERPLCGGHVE